MVNDEHLPAEIAVKLRQFKRVMLLHGGAAADATVLPPADFLGIAPAGLRLIRIRTKRTIVPKLPHQSEASPTGYFEPLHRNRASEDGKDSKLKWLNGSRGLAAEATNSQNVPKRPVVTRENCNRCSSEIDSVWGNDRARVPSRVPRLAKTGHGPVAVDRGERAACGCLADPCLDGSTRMSHLARVKSEPVGSRTGTAKILFTDLVDSTAQRAALGEETAERVRRVHDHLLVEAVTGQTGPW